MGHQQTIPTIVVSRPGVMQQALRTALSLHPEVVILTSAGDALNALHQIIAHHPTLVVIDTNLLPDEVEALLAAIKTAQSPPRCLVLVSSQFQADAMLQAGADAVLPRDSSAQELRIMLELVTHLKA